ncbi:MAG: nickel-responsive transcriptional regulator NikR [Candidatus Thermoplasmatota archaeon]
METVTRIGVSLEPELLRSLDNIIKSEGYTNRSEAIRDIIRKKLIETEWKEDKSTVVGTITMVYDHEIGNVANKLLHIQHEKHANILASTHIHIGEHKCLEVITMQGKAKDIRKLADRLKAIRGVLHSELVTTSKTI